MVATAPPSWQSAWSKGIAEVTDKPITHVVYSHSHSDHIGGTSALGGRPVIVAHAETLRLLKRAADPRRPLPTVTFSDQYVLRVGGKVLELSYHGNAHEPGNIFIYAPAQRVLMVVDIVFPMDAVAPIRVGAGHSWLLRASGAVAHDGLGHPGRGHVARAGTHADVELQAEFNRDIQQRRRPLWRAPSLASA